MKITVNADATNANMVLLPQLSQIGIKVFANMSVIQINALLVQALLIY
jgi:hypothetical protein